MYAFERTLPERKQQIPWTDFPLDEITIYVAATPLGMLAYLPSEH